MIFAAAISSTSAARSLAGSAWMSTTRSTGAKRADSLFSAAASGVGVGVGAAAGSASGADAARADNTRTRQKTTARAILIMAATVTQLRQQLACRVSCFTARIRRLGVRLPAAHEAHVGRRFSGGAVGARARRRLAVRL